MMLSYTYTSRMPPAPWLRNVTSACRVGTPIRLAQLTLSTLEDALVGIIGSQYAVVFTTSGQGCTPSSTCGVGVVTGVVPPVVVGVPWLAGVAATLQALAARAI